MARFSRGSRASSAYDAPASRARGSGWGVKWVLVGLALLLVVGFSSMALWSRGQTEPFDLTQATYVGRDQCVRCHASEVAKYTGSHHDLAMDLATPQTVLGDFSGVELEHLGVTSRMFRDGDRYMIRTEGPDGQLHDYVIKYVFGVTPLQQYMVEFDADEQHGPTTLPRIQVLRVSWDTLQKKWFHLDPPDVAERLAPDDDLHWTGVAQRWNNMCADCHSTNLQKGFDVKSLTYHTTFSEIDVSCESCHGPASQHLELAKQWLPGWNRQRGYGLANLKRSAEDQIQACAPCHSRRNVIGSDYHAGQKFYDHYGDQLLTEGVYYADGQVQDEDYIHGSFIQSKMYHKGIRCTDCHDPHTSRLKHDGNQVCTSCHQHPTAKYDSVAHHFHKPGTPGASCVNCHMPATTYMAVDARHDHSLRIPRPDLSLELNTPNACTGCHLKLENVGESKRSKLKLYQDWMVAAGAGDEEVRTELRRADKWCNDACDKWYGENRKRPEHFGQALAAGRQSSASAGKLLSQWLQKPAAEVPAIARASALQVLSQVQPATAGEAAARLIDDPHPLVRAAACDALSGSANTLNSASLLAKALEDPVRLVRTSAARNLLQFPIDQHPSSTASKLRSATAELTAGIMHDSDRAGAHLSLAIIAEQQGSPPEAITHYRDAIRVEPNVTGARSNLAALLERRLTSQRSMNIQPVAGMEQEIATLRKTELGLLERDVKLLPDAASLRYRLGLALYVDGQKEQSLVQLKKAVELDSHNFEYVQALTLMYKSSQRWNEAREWGEKLMRLTPPEAQASVQAIMSEIERQIP